MRVRGAHGVRLCLQNAVPGACTSWCRGGEGLGPLLTLATLGVAPFDVPVGTNVLDLEVVAEVVRCNGQGGGGRWGDGCGCDRVQLYHMVCFVFAPAALSPSPDVLLWEVSGALTAVRSLYAIMICGCGCPALCFLAGRSAASRKFGCVCTGCGGRDQHYQGAMEPAAPGRCHVHRQPLVRKPVFRPALRVLPQWQLEERH
jgi:hypothetical protein